MTDGHDKRYEAGLDREIALKTLVVSGVSLVAILAASGVLMWWLSIGLRARLVAADPPPPVLEEARTRQLPPEPRLQAAPEEELTELRRREDEFLDGYQWIDETSGIARVPIERAMELMAEGRYETEAGGDS